MTSASDDNSSYDYTFDDLGRVTTIDVDNGGPAVNLMQAYNAVGARTAVATDIDDGATKGSTILSWGWASHEQAKGGSLRESLAGNGSRAACIEVRRAKTTP